MTLFSVVLLTCVLANSTIAEWVDRNHVELIERNDLAPEAAAATSASPGIVVGQFRSLDLVTAGLLRRNGDQVVFQIVACSSKGDCSVELEQDVSRYSRIVFLEKVLKGTTVNATDAAGAPRKVQLTEEAMKINYFEKAAVIYFWNIAQKKWDSVGVAD